MTMGAPARGFTRNSCAQYASPGQPWLAHVDVQRLRGNPDGSRSGTSYKMQRSLIGIMQVIEAHRASILMPHDHLHNNHERSSGCGSHRSGAHQIDLFCMPQWLDRTIYRVCREC
jgi:hypothetical protein